jgi:hypothetical protein
VGLSISSYVGRLCIICGRCCARAGPQNGQVNVAMICTGKTLECRARLHLGRSDDGLSSQKLFWYPNERELAQLWRETTKVGNRNDRLQDSALLCSALLSSAQLSSAQLDFERKEQLASDEAGLPSPTKVIRREAGKV